MQPIMEDGSKGRIEPFNEGRLRDLLSDKEKKIKEVRVFNLRKGMTVEVEGNFYKVVACKEDGRIVLKKKRNASIC